MLQETEEFWTIGKMTEKLPPVARLHKLSTLKISWTLPIFLRRKCSFASRIFAFSSVDFYTNSSATFFSLRACFRLSSIQLLILLSEM